ncbi:MAG: thiamine phosphate synthase [Solirubrobacterales bacterium]
MARLDPRSLGVYVLTSSGLVPERGHRDVAIAAVAGGATAVQLRAKELDDAELLPLAEELSSRCRAAGVLFVVNDRVDVALESGADGLHVGQADELEHVRERVGPEVVLGISVRDARQAQAAELAGADYLGVTVWSTPTKPEAIPRGVEGVREVVAATALPVVGIGGIEAANAAEVLAAGAAGVAVISAVGAAEDPVGATRLLAEVVGRWRSEER